MSDIVIDDAGLVHKKVMVFKSLTSHYSHGTILSVHRAPVTYLLLHQTPQERLEKVQKRMADLLLPQVTVGKFCLYI